MFDYDRLNALDNILSNEILIKDQALLSTFPPDTYIDHIYHYPQLAGYDYVSEPIKKNCMEITKFYCPDILEAYHKLILIRLIVNAKERLQATKLPEDVKEFYEINFKRIVKNRAKEYSPRFLYLYT